jgi:hypothetical protein
MRNTFKDTDPDLIYLGDETGEQTNFPDWKYNDGGVIKFLDGVDTGWENKSPVKTYFDPTVIRVGH